MSDPLHGEEGETASRSPEEFVARLRRASRRRPLHTPDAIQATRVDEHELHQMLERGWAVQGRRHRIVPPVDWRADHLTRSARFQLHCLDPVGTLIDGWQSTNDVQFLLAAIDLAYDWCLHGERSERGVNEPFAWYDMAIGVRAHWLGFVLDAALRRDDIADSTIAVMADTAEQHLTRLAPDETYAHHSNHGFYQALGQLSLAARTPELAGATEAIEQARRRLANIVSEHFTDEGIHREHSPFYASMVLRSIERLVDSDALPGSDLGSHLRTSSEALSWFIHPDGTLAQLGDTDRIYVLDGAPANETTRELTYVLTEGERGTPPADQLRVFPRSGYAIVRAGWPRRDDGCQPAHLLCNAAFHSRTHKHADDLSFIWYDVGRLLLVDAGRYGYAERTEPASDLHRQGFWYGHPDRVFVESTAAHNTVQIDDVDHERRRRRPYGSALEHWATTAHGDYAISAHVRHGSVRHARIWVYRPNRWLVVVDWLHDNHDRAHVYTQRFQAAVDLGCRPWGPTGFLLEDGDGAVLHVVPLSVGMVPLDPVRGQREPRMLGWVSHDQGELLPTTSFGYRARARTVTFATLFHLGGEHVVPRPAELTVSGQGQRLAWESASVTTTLRIRRREGELGVTVGETARE